MARYEFTRFTDGLLDERESLDFRSSGMSKKSYIRRANRRWKNQNPGIERRLRNCYSWYEGTSGEIESGVRFDGRATV